MVNEDVNDEEVDSEEVDVVDEEVDYEELLDEEDLHVEYETLNTDSPNVNKSSKKLTAYSKAILLNF